MIKTYLRRSHRFVATHFNNGDINREIVPLTIKGALFDRDESLKQNLTEARLHRLRPILPNGTVTVGNSCMKNDGAGIALIMEKEMAWQWGLNGECCIEIFVTTGVDPTLLGIGPVPAISQLLKRQKLNIEDISTIELNEAFSSQVGIYK